VAILTSLLNILVVLTSLFLICLVLIQRGKGGGLVGALGGAGGSSAFGTKAGDVFTKITMFTAIFWILLLMALVIISNRPRSAFDDEVPADTSKTIAPAGVPALPGTGTKGTNSTTGPADIAAPPAGSTAPSTAAPAKAAAPAEVSPAGPSAPVPSSPAPAPTTKK
jgi:preprotein translocase subunit SecG